MKTRFESLTIWDIETVPLPQPQLDLMCPEFEAPSNYKDAAKIAENKAEQKRTWIERAALSAVSGQIAMIGVMIGETHEILEGKEQDILKQFWQLFRKNENEYCGFNIKRFDLPFIIRRGYKYGIQLPLGVRNGRYWDDRWLDLFEVWQCGNNQDSISLANLCRFLGVGEKTGSGADFGRLTRDEQISYLRKDLESTRACAERLLT